MRNVALATLVTLGACAAVAAPRPLVPVVFAEPKAGARGDPGGPVLVALPAKDARTREAVKLVDNEAARFIRRLIAKVDAGTKRLPDGLTIVFRPGGNHARTGYRLEGAKRVDRAGEPFVELELKPERLSQTLLHEGGHVVHALVRTGAKRVSWTPIYHSTFAVTDPATALSEGYAIHLEALWGHFGSDRERRAFYHHERAAGEPPDPIVDAFSPVRDLLSFSQNQARYAAVRDGLPAFVGADESDYLRAQYDPGRDRARLKGPQAMVSSEGVVASVFFWTVATRAMEAGAKPGAGLDQPALLNAEAELVSALAAAEKGAAGAFRPDLIDVVTAAGPARAVTIRAFLAQTRGVTATPALGLEWARAWRGALTMDIAAARDASEALNRALADLAKKAGETPAMLRAAVGPVIPVGAPAVKLELKALGEPFPLEVDLNALGSAELALLKASPQARAAIELERARGPFTSVADFEARTKLALKALGLEPVKLD